MTAAERQRRHRLGLSKSRGAKETDMAQGQRLRAVNPLPQTREAFQAARSLKRKRTILDSVEDVVLAIWEADRFQQLTDAIVDSMAIEGSMAIDDTMAAMMIREYAASNGIADLQKQNLNTIRHALRLVLRRYGQGRKQRGADTEPVENGPAAETTETTETTE